MNEQMIEQTSGEPGSLSAGSAVPNSLNVPSESVAALVQPSTPETTDVDSSKLAPEQGAAGETLKVDAPKADAPKAEAPKAEAPKIDAPKAEALKTDAPKVDAPRVDAPRSRENEKPGLRSRPAWTRSASATPVRNIGKPGCSTGGRGGAGGGGGALGAPWRPRNWALPGDGATTAGNSALEATVARIDADIAALRASVEHAARPHRPVQQDQRSPRQG